MQRPAESRKGTVASNREKCIVIKPDFIEVIKTEPAESLRAQAFVKAKGDLVSINKGRRSLKPSKKSESRNERLIVNCITEPAESNVLSPRLHEKEMQLFYPVERELKERIRPKTHRQISRNGVIIHQNTESMVGNGQNLVQTLLS